MKKNNQSAALLRDGIAHLASRPGTALETVLQL